MKIAVHNPKGPEATERYIERALHQQGVETSLYRYPGFFWLKPILSFQPDWVLMSSCNIGFQMMAKDHVSLLRKKMKGIRLAIWTFDQITYGDRETWFVPLARSLDIVFMKDLGLIREYRMQGINCYFLDQGAISETPYGIKPKDGWSCEVAFVGDLQFGPYADERARILKQVASQFRLKIWTHDVKKWDEVGLGSCVMGPIYQEDWPRLAASATVVIGVGCFGAREGCWSNRVYKALGSGCFFLDRYLKGYEASFEAGKHCDWYHTDDEAIEKIRYYISNPEERDRIRKAGYDHVHAHHTYEHRVVKLLDLLNQT